MREISFRNRDRRKQTMITTMVMENVWALFSFVYGEDVRAKMSREYDDLVFEAKEK